MCRSSGPLLGASGTYTPSPFTSGTMDDIVNLPYVTTLPASKLYYQAKYLPSDAISMSYGNGPGNAPSRNSNAILGQIYGTLIVALDGLTAGQIVEFCLIENWECLPRTLSTNFTTATPSKSDPIELSLAQNYLSSNPNLAVEQPRAGSAALTPVGASNSSAVSAFSLQASSKQQEDRTTLFEKIIGGVEKYGPMVAKGISTVASLL